MPSIDQGASTSSSIISLTKTIIGAGLLSMPLAFSTDGIILGTFIVLLAAVTSGFGLFLQCYVSKYVPAGHATFFNLCSITMPSLSVVFDLAITIQCFGCAVSYLVLIGDIAPTIIKSLQFIDESHYRSFWILMSAFICVPLSFLKNLDSLKYTSILGLVAILYMTILVVFHLFLGVPTGEKGDLTLFPPNVSGIFGTFSIIVFAFTGHQNMFSIVNEAKDKTMPALSKLVIFSIMASSSLFILVGLSGYLTYGDKVGGNVILLFPDTPATKLGRFCIIFMVIFSFPLMLHPARISLNNIYFWFYLNFCKNTKPEEGNQNETTTLLHSEEEQGGDELNISISRTRKANIVPFSNTSFIVITAILLVLGYSLAICVTSFALVLAIVGATGSTAISFILPGLFGYKLMGSESDDPSTLEIIFKNLSLVLIGWGFCVMILCLYTSLSSH